MTEDEAHDALQKVVQKIADETGVRVESFRVRWVDVSPIGKVTHEIMGTALETAKGRE
jgi:predicted component of type VI protein secretion system